MSKYPTSALSPRTLSAFFFLPLMFLSLALLIASGKVHARDPVPNADSQVCLSCHAEAGMKKAMAGGESLSLQIQGKAFAKSAHNDIGCAGCHPNVDVAKHPAPDGKKKVSLREYSIARMETCRQCHEDKFKLYEGSIHAALVREGNSVAPLCGDCHSPHAVRAKPGATPMAEVACRQCHSDIYDAYATSVHGQSRAQAGSSAPLCPDCHKAHDVAPAASGEPIKEVCLTCHASALSDHQKWLPNADRHFQAVSCGACHAPGVPRRVDLKLFDTGADAKIAEKQGVPWFEARAHSADLKGQGLDALAVQSLLTEFNHNGNGNNTVLRGRLEVANGADGHRLAHKEKAVKECTNCHQAGADPFQKVTLSMVDGNGRPMRVGAQKEVLNSALSVDSVRGFYAIGGTRIKLLDWALLAVLAIGVMVPIGHFTLRWLFRKYLNKMIQKYQAANASAKDDSTKS